MEDNLIKLLESNYFSTKESSIINIINKRCVKDFPKSLQTLLSDIDEALNCDYMKQLENKFDKTENESCQIINEIQVSIDEIESIKAKGKCATDKSEDIFQMILEKHNEIKTLEEQYQLIEKKENQLEIISAIQSCLILDDIPQACEYLEHLLLDIQSLGSWPTDNSAAPMQQRLFTYHQKITVELTRQFEECLKEIHWPFISNSLQRTSSDLELEKIQSVSERFSAIFKQLFVTEMPEHLRVAAGHAPDLISTTFLTNCTLDRISFPIQLLLQPLVKYFQFFFWTDSKVNKLSKPEWYMTQVIQWITVHHTVLGELFSENILELVDGQLEFIRGLVILVMGKVHKDLELISLNSQKNEELFFHLVEETLTMTMDLRKSFDYPRSYPDPIDVICNSNEVFENWMKLEQRFAFKQLDEIFLHPGAWKALSSQCKRVECLNSFIGLISATKERIQCLFDITRQTRFCELLLQVLDDFRLRLLQISKNYNGNSQRWYDIMNVVYSVKILLRNWRLDQMFITIHDHNKAGRVGNKIANGESNDSRQPEPKKTKTASFTSSSLYSNRTRTIDNLKLSTDSVFSDTLCLYQHVLEEMEEQCIDSSFEEVSERADTYMKTSWLEIGTVVVPRLMSLSPSASGMLLVLRDCLHRLGSSLEPELFEHVWHGLATKFSKLLFNSVIRAHKFNELGASQLDFDIRKNLLPLFLPYTKSPERFFVKCLEACTLLNLKRGTAMLIKQILTETLHSDNNTRQVFSRSRPECPIRTLNEIGVVALMPEEAEYILNLRIDTN